MSWSNKVGRHQVKQGEMDFVFLFASLSPSSFLPFLLFSLPPFSFLLFLLALFNLRPWGDLSIVNHRGGVGGRVWDSAWQNPLSVHAGPAEGWPESPQTVLSVQNCDLPHLGSLTALLNKSQAFPKRFGS